VRRSESTEHELYRLARSTMLAGSPVSLNDWLDAFDTVTADDIMAVADDVIKNDLLTVTMYGNKVKSMKGFKPSQIEI
jgi:predicted Zn-dependent peptidase